MSRGRDADAELAKTVARHFAAAVLLVGSSPDRTRYFVVRAWVDAGVAAHTAEAMRQPIGWVRQGRELRAHGLAVWCIEKYGLEVGRNRRLAQELVQWVAQGMEPFSSADEFRRSLIRDGETHTFALQLSERLQLAAHVPEVLPASVAEWIEVQERVGS